MPYQKQFRQPADMSSILEPTYPSSGMDRGPVIKTCLPEILEQSTENNQSGQQSSPDSKSRQNLFSSNPTPTQSNHSGSGSRARLPATSHGSDIKEIFRPREVGNNQYDESPLLRHASNINQSDNNHSSLIKSKSISNVQKHCYKQSTDQQTPKDAETQNSSAYTLPELQHAPTLSEPQDVHTLPEPQHAHESSHPKPVPRQDYSSSEQQPQRNEQHQPPQLKQQSQICDDRTPR